MEVPAGWVQVLRGPRPRAEKWPSAAQKRSSTDFPSSKKVERWRQPGVQPPEAARERGPDPDTVLQEARRRVASLEAALQAMGDFQGPEVDVLKNALSRAQQAARTRPLKEQLAQNDTFIQRSQKRIASLEPERAEEQALLDKALVRQERLKQEVAAAEPVPAEVPMQESSTEVLFLRAKVAQLEAERIPIQSEGPSTPQRVCGPKRKTGNCPEDNLPTNQQDLYSWLESKQLELRDALDVHDMESVSLLTGLISRGASAMNSLLQPSSVAHMVH